MRTLLVGFFALAACSGSNDTMSGDDGPPPPPPPGDEEAQIQQDYDDVAAVVGANVNSGELSAMVDSINLSYGRIPPDLVENPPGILTGTRNGLAISYKFYCRDTADLPTPCNGLEDHLHLRVDWTGTISSANAAMDGLTRTGSWIARDIITPTPRVGGHGTTSFTASLATGVYDVSIADEFGHVKFDALAPLLPIGGGTMDLTLTVHRSRDAVGDRDFVVTAHLDVTAPDVATISLDGVHSYDLTISSGAVVRVN